MEKTFQCQVPDCPKSFTTKWNLDEHVKTKHLSLVFTCDQCNKPYTRKSRLNSHIQTVHNNVKPYCCNTCQKRFGRKDHLKQHEKTHGERMTHNCGDCDAKFYSKQKLKFHVASQHSANSEAWPCSLCGTKLKRKDTLARHMSDNCSRILECFYCKNTYPTAAECTKCENDCAVKMGKSTFCRDCGKKFVLRKNRLQCEKTHNIGANGCLARCEKCNTDHYWKEALRCERGFYGKNLERGYYCRYCGKKFPTRSDRYSCFSVCNSAAYDLDN